MRTKLYSTGILLGIAALLFYGAYVQGSRYGMKVTLGNLAETILEKSHVITESEAEFLKVKIYKAQETKVTQELSTHYGFYRITDFYPAEDKEAIRMKHWDSYWGASESDMLLGRIVQLKPEGFIVWEKKQDQINRLTIKNPEYKWEGIEKEQSDAILSAGFDLGEPVEGLIVIPNKSVNKVYTEFYFYTFADKDKLLMSVGGGGFLLERCETVTTPISEWNTQKKKDGAEPDLSAWIGKYTYLEGFAKIYEIEVYENELGEYEANIEIKAEAVGMDTKISAFVYESGGGIIFVFKECLTGEEKWEWENRWSDILLSLKYDGESENIYTYWGELHRNKAAGIDFVKEQE